MTNRRSFFGALAGLFTGLSDNGSSPRRKAGRVVRRKYDQEFRHDDGSINSRWLQVIVEGGEWADCPSIDDRTSEGFHVKSTRCCHLGFFPKDEYVYWIEEVSAEAVKRRVEGGKYEAERGSKGWWWL